MSTTDGDARDQALILVVERDPQVRLLERFFLEQAGFRIEFTDDGFEALEKARRLLPRILITEILVPRLDGLEVCRRLKGDTATREVRVLVFSILSARERALEAGADDFLRKPLNDGLLLERVEQLLDHGPVGVTP